MKWPNYFQRCLSALRKNTRGNVAITFAIAALPIVGTVGFAVDYSHANSVKAAMQAALDSTALMLSKEAATLSDTDLQTKAQNYFKALFTRPEANSISISASYAASGGSQVVVNGSAQVPTSFLGIIGYQNIPVTGTSTATWGAGKIELALVLDNTGSMLDNGKIGALISASHQLLDTLKNSATNPGDVKVAIIPFTTEVNIGTAYKNKPWIDWSYINKSGGGGDQCGWDQEEENGTINNWTGGVVDRLEPYNVQDTTPTSDKNTWYPAVMSSLTPIQPLTSDWTALNAKIDMMKAYGKTNLTIGLVWGWHALTSSEPLTEATAPSANITKIMVFLTDGQNTQDRWTTNSTAIDTRTKAVCANIKAAGIKLYTVRVMDGNKTLLQNCASDPTMYYEVNNSNQMASVFSQLAGDLSTLRIAK